MSESNQILFAGDNDTRMQIGVVGGDSVSDAEYERLFGSAAFLAGRGGKVMTEAFTKQIKDIKTNFIGCSSRYINSTETTDKQSALLFDGTETVAGEIGRSSNKNIPTKWDLIQDTKKRNARISEAKEISTRLKKRKKRKKRNKHK